VRPTRAPGNSNGGDGRATKRDAQLRLGRWHLPFFVAFEFELLRKFLSPLHLTSMNFSRSFFVDAFPGADGHDFAFACCEPINDSTSSYSQTPISLKLLFECFPATRIVEDVCHSGADFAL
jgi:hypothetical protein